MKSTNKEKKLSLRKRLFTSGSAGDVVTLTFIEIGLVLSILMIFFFWYAAPPARNATHERRKNKAGGIIRWEKSFDCVLNIDPCLSCSTS